MIFYIAYCSIFLLLFYMTLVDIDYCTSPLNLFSLPTNCLTLFFLALLFSINDVRVCDFISCDITFIAFGDPHTRAGYVGSEIIGTLC